MPESLSGPELGVLLTFLVGATVLGVQKAKQWAAKHPKLWTARIPWWVWLALSVAIPFGLTFLVAQQWAQNLINPMLPENLKLSIGPDAVTPTAISAAIGANGAYAVGKRLGMTGDFKPGGSEWVGPTEKEESPVLSGPAESSQPSAAELPVQPPVPAPVPNTVRLDVKPEKYPQLVQVPGSKPPLYVVEYPEEYWKAS